MMPQPQQGKDVATSWYSIVFFHAAATDALSHEINALPIEEGWLLGAQHFRHAAFSARGWGMEGTFVFGCPPPAHTTLVSFMTWC